MKHGSENLMVTVSGGRSSARMARHIQTSEKYRNYKKVYVFANTGQERVETIEFLRNIVIHWGINLNIVEGVYSNEMGVGVGYCLKTFETMSMNSEPFEGVIMQKNKGVFDGLPHKEAPYCSENLKTIPCKKFADQIFGANNYVKAIGYRLEDMPKRISWPEIKADNKRIFPLLTDFEYPIGQRELNEWWSKEPFQLGIHNKFGNCELCWKKSDQNLIDNIRKGTRSINWWKKMEAKYGNTSFRNNKSIDDLVALAKLPFTQEMQFPDDDGCVCSF